MSCALIVVAVAAAPAAPASWLWKVIVRETAPLVSVSEYSCAGAASPPDEIELVQVPLAVVVISEAPIRIEFPSVLPKSKPVARSMKPPVSLAGVESTLLV